MNQNNDAVTSITWVGTQDELDALNDNSELSQNKIYIIIEVSNE